MKRDTEIRHIWAVRVLGLFVGMALVFPLGGEALPKAAADQAVSYNVNASMADNLKSLTDKRVLVTLSSGKSLAGTVKAVGDHLLHLEKLEGKEFFDALILIQDIEAIETRIRGN
jgi:hypothetical protein